MTFCGFYFGALGYVCLNLGAAAGKDIFGKAFHFPIFRGVYLGFQRTRARMCLVIGESKQGGCSDYWSSTLNYRWI